MIKDAVEFFDERIKSPFYTYIVFSFLVTNWQPLFYLFFADTSVATRFTYFNIKTDFWSLLVITIVLGGVGALAAPWLRYIGARWAELPIKLRKLRQVQTALEIRKKRGDYASEINQQVDEVIEQSIEQSKKIAKIESDDVRKLLNSQIASIKRDMQTILKPESVPKELSELDYRIKLLEDRRDVARNNNNNTLANSIEQDIRHLILNSRT